MASADLDFVCCLIYSYPDLLDPPSVEGLNLKGEIFDGQLASADNLNKSLRTAYETKGLQAIILRIDSPGGSPVQADYMFNTIRHYRPLHPDVKYYAVCMDSCTSAAYYLAAAADEIYASPASVVGSIGVIYNGVIAFRGNHLCPHGKH